ncbi:MAG TPA: hypothetical protein VF224_10085 [Aestuariivirga sp.]|jgi:hypothetical protein
MLKSTSILTLLLALGVFSAGPILTNFAPLGATAAYAESDDDSRSGIEDDDDDDSIGDDDDSDDNRAVGASIGPVFDEGAVPDLTCKEPACKVK